MKKSLTLLSLFFTLVISGAFAQDLPKTGAVIRSSENEVNLVNGQTTQIELTLVRSKADRKTSFDLPVVQEIEGLHASVSETDIPDTYKLTLTPTTLSGDYLLIVKGGGVNKQYVTSSMLKLVVTESATLAKEN